MQSSIIAPVSTILSLVLALSTVTLPAQDTGEKWELLNPATNPGERIHYMAEFFPLTGKTILFGGKRVNSGVLPGTWEWDGVEWTELNPLGSPPSRSHAAMAYDPIRERMVLYGGIAGDGTKIGSTVLGDTWEFDGDRWTHLFPANTPPPLASAAMAWDVPSEKVLMYGGALAFESGPTSETWVFDGADWEQLMPAQSPGPLRDHRMVTDTKRERIVLFGGSDVDPDNDPPQDTNRTWEWSRGVWIFQNRVRLPSERRTFAMAYDSIRDLTVLSYGTSGGGGRLHGDTWIWDGAVWRRNDFLDPRPGPRGSNRMVANPNTGRLMMYGGQGSGIQLETWEFFGPGIAQATPFGDGCPGTSGTRPLLSGFEGSRPIAGTSFQLQFSSLPTSPNAAVIGFWGLSNKIWRDTQFFLPEDLVWLGMPDCNLLVSMDRLVPLSMSDSTASWSINTPSEISLVGLDFFMQGLVVDPGANALGLITSNGIRAQIGVQ